jgi:hypothetical protein
MWVLVYRNEAEKLLRVVLLCAQAAFTLGVLGQQDFKILFREVRPITPDDQVYIWNFWVIQRLRDIFYSQLHRVYSLTQQFFGGIYYLLLAAVIYTKCQYALCAVGAFGDSAVYCP